MKDKFFKILPLILVTLFFISYFVPLIILMLFSFNSTNSAVNWTGFSFQWYENLFTNDRIIQAVINTVIVAVLATITSLIIGTLAAIGLTKTNKRARNNLLKLNNFPIINPEIITAVGLLILFTTIGIERGLATMLLAHIAFCIPYVIINVYPKLKSLDNNIVDAAMDLGATPMTAIFKAIIPQIKGTLFAAGAIAFSMSFDDFIITRFTSGGEPNISVTLFFSMRQGIDLTFNALGTIIMFIIIIKVIVDIFLQNKKKTEVKI